MKVVTIDGKEWEVKYMQNKESLSFNVGTAVYNYPDFVGSKLYHNSTGSDVYSLTFSIHRTLFESFKSSIKKFVTNESEAVTKKGYGKLTDIIIEHRLWGKISGKIIGELKANTSSEADIICSCGFQVNTKDDQIIKKDIQDENTRAVDLIDSETAINFNVELSTRDKSALSRFATNLQTLYSNIQNSAVVSAFNDLNSALNSAVLDSLRIMSSVKNILSLPNKMNLDLNSKATLLKSQANAIIDIPVTSYNLALFNTNCLTYNTGATSKTAFVSENAQRAAAGIKVVPMT